VKANREACEVPTPERLEHPRHLAKLSPRDEAAPQRLLRSLAQELGDSPLLAQSLSVRLALVAGTGPNDDRSSGATSPWWSTTPAGTRSRRRRHASGGVRFTWAGSTSESCWSERAVWCESTPACSEQSQAVISSSCSPAG
jgi:hypothetical protein